MVIEKQDKTSNFESPETKVHTGIRPPYTQALSDTYYIIAKECE